MKRTAIVLLTAAAVVNALFAAEIENKNELALAEARKAIDKGNAQWIEGWDKADAGLIASLFANDGILLSRNGKLFKGPEEVLGHMKPVLESAGTGVKATVTTVDLWLDDNTAYETGKYTYTYQGSGKPVRDEGRYVTIWKRQSDRAWKIAMDMAVPKS
jgi:uncharacterized protein (TIGR02246 family)